MKEIYKKYVNWIVAILFILFCGKSCQSCNDKRRSDWNIHNYELIIDSIENDKTTLELNNRELKDSIKFYMFKLEEKNNEIIELKSNMKYIKNINNNLIETTNNLSKIKE